MIRALYAIPASSSALFVSSPAVEATCVPCPSESNTVVPMLVTKSMGLTRRLAARSGLVAYDTLMFWIAVPCHVATVIVAFAVVMPVSTMATMMLGFAPGLMSHALG